jgi:polar amino acid transport system substrate-binding protein
MTINEELLKTTNCSDPYVVNAQVVVMKADVVAQYADITSLKDLTVAVESGSTGEAAAKEAGIEKLVATQDMATALMEVAAGTSDACIIDITMANAMTGSGTDYAGLGYSLKLNTEEYGVGFRKDSDLTAQFNAFMDKLIADGTLPALAEKYGLTLAG